MLGDGSAFELWELLPDTSRGREFNGQTTPGEAVAEAYSVLNSLDPEDADWAKRMGVEAYLSAIADKADAHGLPTQWRPRISQGGQPAPTPDVPAKPFKARKGDLVAIQSTTRDYVIGQGTSTERTDVKFGMVESVDRDGRVKTYRPLGYGDNLVSEGAIPVTNREKTLAVSQDRVDVGAVLRAAKAHTYPNSDTPMPFESVEAAARMAKQFEVKEGDTAPPPPIIDEATGKGLRVGDRVVFGEPGSPDAIEATVTVRAEETTKNGYKVVRFKARTDSGKEGFVYLKPTEKVRVLSRAGKQETPAVAPEPAPAPAVLPVDPAITAAIAAKEAELEAAKKRFQAAADYQAGGSNKKITFARRMDSALARAGQAGRDIERLEHELKVLRAKARPQAPPATQEDIDNLAPDDLIKMKNGLVYRVVKVNKATVKVKVERGMDDLMPKSKIVRVQKAGVVAPAAAAPPTDITPDRLAMLNSPEQDGTGQTFSQRVAGREGDKVRDARSVAALATAPDNPTFRNFNEGAHALGQLTVAEAQLPDGTNDRDILRNQYRQLLGRIGTIKRQGPASRKSKDQYYRPLTALLEEAAQFVHEYGGESKTVAKLRALADLYRPEGDRPRPLRSRAEIDAERDKLAAQRAASTANLDKARTAKAEKRVEELNDSIDPRDNAAKIKALAEGRIDSITLYRQSEAGPSGQRRNNPVARIRHTPDNPSGEFRVGDPSSGDLVGWIDRVPFDGQMMWAVRRENGDGAVHFQGYAETMALGADILTFGLHGATGRHDSRRISPGRFVTADEALKIREREARAERERLATVAAERMRGAVDTRTVEDLPNYTIDRLLDSQSVDPEVANMRRRAMAERIRRDSGTPFREGQRVMHATRGEVTYHFPDEAKRDGTFSWVEFDDGNGGIVMTESLSPLDTSRAKRDDGDMTTTAPKAAASEPTLGVRQTSAGRETTVTLPDGTTEKRTSKTRAYTHAIVGTTDLHGAARRRQAANDRRRAFVEAFEAWRARGSNFAELKAYPSANLSVSDERRGMSRTEYYLPGFEPTREPLRGGRTYWSDGEQFSLPDPNDRVQTQGWVKDPAGRPFTMVDSGKTRFDEFDPDKFVARHRDMIDREQAAIDKLTAGPQYAYSVVRWSQSADNAFKAIGSFDDRETRYQVITVGGEAVHQDVKVKTGPTEEEKAAAKLTRAAEGKAEQKRRDEEWVQRKVASIRRGLTEGNDNFARSEVVSTNDRGLRMIGRAFGIKSTPRGMGDQEKTEWLRKAILEAARGSGPKA